MIVSLVGVLFFLIGLGVLVSGIFSILKIRQQVKNSARAVGTVTGFGEKMGKSGYIYCPQVAFIDTTGKKIEFESEVGTQPPAYTIGQRVQIIYQKDFPQKAEIDSIINLWFVPGCMLAFALIFSVLGVVLFVLGIFIQFKT